KTGTLTEGKPRLTSVLPVPEFDETKLLQLAASLERGSEHPLAAAIVSGAEQRGIEIINASDFVSITGKGVTGVIDGEKVSLGNRALVEDLGVEVRALDGQAEKLRRL